MTYIVMACMIMASIVMAYMAMAYIPPHTKLSKHANTTIVVIVTSMATTMAVAAARLDCHRALCHTLHSRQYHPNAHIPCDILVIRTHIHYDILVIGTHTLIMTYKALEHTHQL